MRITSTPLASGSVTLLALCASGAAASAVPITFGYTGAIQSFTVPTTGTYDIVAIGAGGGTSYAEAPGGLGARIEDSYDLTAGDVFSIVAGGRGSDAADGPGGGGGGSFVVPSKLVRFSLSMLVAGGGGGGGGFFSSNSGGNGLGPYVGSLNGNGGAGGNGRSGGGGGGGGGFIADGGTGATGMTPSPAPMPLPGGSGGRAFENGAAGGGGGIRAGSGGFGGGGFGGDAGGGGGGGGFDGGAGGSGDGSLGGLGGTSFDENIFGNTSVTLGANAGNGSVTITELSGLISPTPAPVPEPASLALLGTAGLLSLRLTARRRRA